MFVLITTFFVLLKRHQSDKVINFPEQQNIFWTKDNL